MAKASEQTKEQATESLFAKATSDVSAIKTVGNYIRTGRRWDLTHKDVVGDLIVIQSSKDINTKYGPAVLVDVDHQGEQKTVLFGGQVLIDQIHEIGVNLPVLAIIRKPARAYTLMSPTPEEVEAYRQKYMQ